MSDVLRKSLVADDLRAAKDEVIERVANQARALGAEPRVDGIEDFVGPILRKVEVDHEDIVRRGGPPSRNGQEPRERADREGVEFETKEIGSFDFNTGTFAPSAEGQKVLAAREARARRETFETRALRHALRMTRHDPDFKVYRDLAMKMAVKPGPPEVKRQAMNLLIEKFMQEYTKKYGDPRNVVRAGQADDIEGAELKRHHDAKAAGGSRQVRRAEARAAKKATRKQAARG